MFIELPAKEYIKEIAEKGSKNIKVYFNSEKNYPRRDMRYDIYLNTGELISVFTWSQFIQTVYELSSRGSTLNLQRTVATFEKNSEEADKVIVVEYKEVKEVKGAESESTTSTSNEITTAVGLPTENQPTSVQRYIDALGGLELQESEFSTASDDSVDSEDGDQVEPFDIEVVKSKTKELRATEFKLWLKEYIELYPDVVYEVDETKGVNKLVKDLETL